ncbi:hypothetical protein SAMN05192558_103291 [Actinokineospora alba]|uniref:Uncharacterized protein n=1 Tax=Actinokineospora alba TaxID=504798 RepID=A0A1H0K1J2_9PSEU|nr:hypothetical protein C8E96_3651 [Actinokineospora alba]SDH92142.1 hypothetical protein SAMN05421871_102758 [Actinokineospora alba]SDO49541.1 hypothetical protein SAMN05192558_103291 [Actinokineospora alba]
MSAGGLEVVGCDESVALSAMRLTVAGDGVGVSAMGSVLVVRAADAEDLLRAWDTGVTW